MLRTTTLSLLLLLSAGIIIPLANSAHGLRQNTQVGVHHNHRYHSRAWWRRYRARMRARRAAAEMAHRNALLSQPQNLPVGDFMAGTSTMSTSVAPANSAVAPSAASTSASVTLPGQMNLSVVALSRPNPAFLTSREESRMLAGINVSELRRIVIDKMVMAGGWVTND